MDQPLCEFCGQAADFSGWFYTEAVRDPWAVGTATAGLLQYRDACCDCWYVAAISRRTPATLRELLNTLNELVAQEES